MDPTPVRDPGDGRDHPLPVDVPQIGEVSSLKRHLDRVEEADAIGVIGEEVEGGLRVQPGALRIPELLEDILSVRLDASGSAFDKADEVPCGLELVLIEPMGSGLWLEPHQA